METHSRMRVKTCIFNHSELTGREQWRTFYETWFSWSCLFKKMSSNVFLIQEGDEYWDNNDGL